MCKNKYSVSIYHFNLTVIRRLLTLFSLLYFRSQPRPQCKLDIMVLLYLDLPVHTYQYHKGHLVMCVYITSP